MGGIQIYVHGTDGITYYYAHLSKWVHGMRSGDHVSKAQVIGYVGDSGNARGGAPHLHLGIIAGGIHVNPYPTVRRVC